MTEAPRLKYRDEAIVVGAMLLLLGVVCNEFLLEGILAPDGEWGASRDAFYDLFPDGRFTVMLWPVAPFERDATQRFAERGLFQETGPESLCYTNRLT